MDENALTKKPHCTQPEGRRLLSSGAARTFGFCQHMLLLRDEGRYVATFYDANEIQQRCAPAISSRSAFNTGTRS